MDMWVLLTLYHLHCISHSQCKWYSVIHCITYSVSLTLWMTDSSSQSSEHRSHLYILCDLQFQTLFLVPFPERWLRNMWDVTTQLTGWSRSANTPRIYYFPRLLFLQIAPNICPIRATFAAQTSLLSCFAEAKDLRENPVLPWIFCFRDTNYTTLLASL